jgi:voltage-gated potassium channel
VTRESTSADANHAAVWKQLESGRVVHRFEPIVIVATLALIPVLVIETDAKSPGWQDVASAANWAIWAIFLAELIFILVVAPRKAAALRAHWLDTVIVVTTVPAFGAFLSSLRFARFARLLRLLRLGTILTRLIQRERLATSGTAFRLAAMLTLLVVIVSGAVESLVDSGDFQSTWQGIWWAVATVTTVGYGDVTPTTVQGQVVAIVVMLFGIAFLSVLTATIASRFVKTERGSETEEILAALARLEAQLADLRRQVGGA